MSLPIILDVALMFAIIISAHPTHHSKRVKRIAFGRDLKSNSIFGTQFFVELRHNYDCTIDHSTHLFLQDTCRSRHLCGSSLIHPQFVISAAHCLTYGEYVVKQKGPTDAEWPGDVAFKFAPVAMKTKHTWYTDYALMAGGTNLHEMTQARHSLYIFPHPTWSEIIEYSRKTNTSLDTLRYIYSHSHDFILVQACQPFTVDANVKLAQLGSKMEMQSHYESIVKQGLVCLYLGLGFLDEEEWVQHALPPYTPPYSNWTQYTWRPSQCHSGCKSFSKATAPPDLGVFRHNCQLCSTNLGPVLNEFLGGDSGSPVICDGKLTAIVSFGNGLLLAAYNSTNAAAYAIYCSRNMITKRRLEYYLTLKPNTPIHPLFQRKYKLLD